MASGLGLATALRIVRAPTCSHDVLRAGEALVDGGADGAKDQHAAKVAVAHQRAPQEAPILILSIHITGDQVHDAVRPWDALVLTPPARYHQGHVETWGRIDQISPARYLSDIAGSAGEDYPQCISLARRSVSG